MDSAKKKLVISLIVLGVATILLLILTFQTASSEVHSEELLSWPATVKIVFAAVFSLVGLVGILQLPAKVADEEMMPGAVASVALTLMTALAFANSLSWAAGLGMAFIVIGAFLYSGWRKR